MAISPDNWGYWSRFLFGPGFHWGLYFCLMHRYRYVQGDYMITIYYQGRKLTYRLKQFHQDRNGSSWHLFSRSGLQELYFDFTVRQLTHVVQHGQRPFPREFLEVLEQEIRDISKA